MDRRVKYTKRVLNESLIHFLEQKDISRITVTELCADADINRSTYYVHFKDPYDQLSQFKEELVREISVYAKTLDTDTVSPAERPYRVLRKVLQYVEPRKNIFRLLLSESGDHKLQRDILSILGEIALPVDSRWDPEEKEAWLIYASNGCFGLFYYWLMSDTPISSDQIALRMSKYSLSSMQFQT